MSLPLPVILRELESPSSIVPVLRTLHYLRNLLDGISKPDLRHLVSRTLNLARSNDPYLRWCGINVIKVLSTNYAVLSGEGAAFVTQLLQILDQQNARSDPKILNSTIECLNSVCDNIRGKPTLTREVLTPKLPTIISMYLAKLELLPLLVIKSLHRLIRFHPTTFRPFGNKLRVRLLELVILPQYVNFPPNLKDVIGRTVASLPAIEKTDPDAKWAADVLDLIKELVQVVQIYGNFLAFDDDEDLSKLIKSMPQADDDSLFPGLHINAEEPGSVMQISTRIEVLLDLLRGYLVTETQFAVRVPLGQVLVLGEIICSVNTRLLNFKREIRDPALRRAVASSLVANHANVVKLLAVLPEKFRGALVMHLPRVFSFLETVVPFKDRRISAEDVVDNEDVYTGLLDCVGKYLSLVRQFGDNTQLTRFIEAALLLVEPRTKAVSTEPPQKRKKNKVAVPFADILSHEHLFVDDVPHTTVLAVQSFIDVVITRVVLPTTQHYKLMRYLVVQAVRAKKHSLDLTVPETLRKLLVDSVLFPATEKASMLPLVSHILGDDPLVSVFTNPRFPHLPTRARQLEEPELEDDSQVEFASTEVKEEVEEKEERAEIEPPAKKQKPSHDVFTPVEPGQVVQFAEAKHKLETATAKPEQPEPEPVPTAPSEPSAPSAPAPDSDSDFEIPALDGGDSDEE